MLELRLYQREAIESLYNYFGINTGNPLIVLPTGTGKSLVIADFVRGAIEAWPSTRILVGCHVKELVGQNYAEFMGILPFADAGLHSAGLKRRDKENQILFFGIQSAYRKAYEFQRCDLLLIDEAHTIPPDGDGMWRTFIDELKRINPDMKIVGLTATDYRMASGLLTSGDIFTDVCYEYPLGRALKENYLSPVIPKGMATKYDLSSVGTRGGEYIAGELEKAMDIDTKTLSAIDEIEAYGYGRKSWLVFASGNDHARHIHEELARRGYKGAVVTQETERAERDQAVRDIKSGNIRYLVNNKIFTTGFNAPNIDLIADLGPTKSPGLHVQKMGRGMRLYDGKQDCLVLDFAGNVELHGPLDQIRGRNKSKGDGDAPIKVCPECHTLCFAGLRKCFKCGYEFPFDGPSINGTSGDAALLSDQIQPEWRDVLDISYKHNKKEGKQYATMLVTYTTIQGRVFEAVCFDHPIGNFARRKAEAWHVAMGHPLAAPSSVKDALEYVYRKPTRILVGKDGKWDRILEYDFATVEVVKEESFEIPF